MRKIPKTGNLAVRGIFLIQLFPNWTACSPITKRLSKNYPIYFKLDSLQKLIINRYVGNIGFCDAAI